MILKKNPVATALTLPIILFYPMASFSCQNLLMFCA